MKFNGWQRLGITGSVLWALTAGPIELSRIDRAATAQAEDAVQVCVNSFPTISDQEFAQCGPEYSETYTAWAQNDLEDAAAVAIIPVPVFWLLACLAVCLWRWVVRGFQVPRGRDSE